MLEQETPYVVRREDARVFYEGPEECREYLRTGQMWFGSSLVNPGETGAIDPGHPQSVEVFYCVSGAGYLDDGQQEYFLEAGDAFVVPPPIPHRIHNRGEEPVLMVWAGAPGEES